MPPELPRRAVCLGLAGAMVAGPAVAWPGRVSREVLAFYYGWYGDPTDKATWRGVDDVRHHIDNAAHYPEAGAYSSADPEQVRRQMRQMRAAGITGLIYSWWGKGSYEDRHFQLVMDSARAQGLKVSVYYETCPRVNKVADPAGVAAELAYLLDTYAGADNWLRVGDKRVVFIYAYPITQLGHDVWRGIVAQTRQRHGDSVFFDADAESSAGLDFMDGIHRYALIASVGARPPAQVAAWAHGFYPRYLREQAGYGVRALTVYPGYDDTHLTRARPIDSGRFDGQLYAALWREAAALSPDWILVVSWNEWHEGSEIEPSREFGGTFLDLTGRFAGEFLRK